MQVEELVGRGHLTPVLAAWHHDEWGHLYPTDTWDLLTAVREFKAMADAGAVDRTWVAFDGNSREVEVEVWELQQFWGDRKWSVVADMDAEGHLATVMVRNMHPHGTCSTYEVRRMDRTRAL